MTTKLIMPDQLPTWVPGRLTVHSPEQGWDGMSVRGYLYPGHDVEVPPMRDYMIVGYRQGTTVMQRRLDGQWKEEKLGPGDVSLLTRATESHWVWPQNIEVVHVYLTQDEVAATCRQMYECEVAEVELHDVVKANDPAIYRTVMTTAAEAAHQEPGSLLIVQSLACQLAVHLLRRHAHVRFREHAPSDGLSFRQTRQVEDFVRTHLGSSISLDDLARVAGLSRYHFARRFRLATGTSPHEFVLQQRLAQARMMLERSRSPLREIAALAGFSDQSHLTRVFKQRLGVTPGQYRTMMR